MTIAKIKKQLKAEDEQNLILGTMLALAADKTPWLAVVDAIGIDAALALVTQFGGSSLKVPELTVITSGLNAAGAAYSVFKKRETVDEASKTFDVPAVIIKKGLKVLTSHEGVKRRMWDKHRKISAQLK